MKLFSILSLFVLSLSIVSANAKVHKKKEEAKAASEAVAVAKDDKKTAENNTTAVATAKPADAPKAK